LHGKSVENPRKGNGNQGSGAPAQCSKRCALRCSNAGRADIGSFGMTDRIPRLNTAGRERPAPGSDVHGLQDVVAEMLAQHGPGVLVGLRQGVSEGDVTVLVEFDHAMLFEPGNKSAE